jgi:hypothetical protein
LYIVYKPKRRIHIWIKEVRNMNSLIKKLIKGGKPTIRELQDALYLICDDVHSSCDCNCPVYEINGGPLNPCEANCGCSCFKDGKAMYDFIKSTGFIIV